MMSLDTINRMAKDAASQAAKNKMQPYVAFEDKDDNVLQCPFLGDYIPRGWEVIDTLFVDSSGLAETMNPP